MPEPIIVVDLTLDDCTACLHCDETVEPRDQHPHFQNQPMHFACGFRSIAGSLGHLQRRCHCFVPPSIGGPEPQEDPPGMTKRQAAQIALDYFRDLEALNAKYDERVRAAA